MKYVSKPSRIRRVSKTSNQLKTLQKTKKSLHKDRKLKTHRTKNSNSIQSFQTKAFKVLRSFVRTTSSRANNLKSYLLSTLSVFIIFIGFIFVFLAATNSLGLDWNHPFLVKPSVIKTLTVQSKPINIYIPKLKRVLSVSDGEFVNNHWTISPTGVSYLATSATPGSIGNSVI
ncbi:hypothetical protein HY024_02940, partial [Candidatus Curtissbacteria bacterium]|nr:hypothetical protein [Candidatus Curtissbacteria bacterium]